MTSAMQASAQFAWDAAGLGAVLDATTDALVVVDADGSILLVNAVAEKLFGYSSEELVGQVVEILVPAELRAAHEVTRKLYTAAPHVVEMGAVPDQTAARKDGTTFPIETRLSPVRTTHGVVIVATVRDISLKRDEERLFRGLLEAAPDAMVIVDSGARIVLVNAQVETLFGYERSELVGQHVEVLVPARFSGGHVAFRNGYMHGPRTRPMGLAGDLFARRKDATEFPVEISLAPLETPDGLLISAAVRDISERKRLQDETDLAKDEFFATVSHELRTPLTSMIGYAELLHDLGDLGPQAESFLGAISRSASRELRLVNDLLTLVNIEQSGLAIQRREVELGALVREALDTARPDVEERGITLSADLPDAPLRLSGDRDRIGQALDNLISNAVKFCRHGGLIQVALRVAADEAQVDITDDGAGLSEVDAARVFERLYRAPDAVRSQIPGAGLGLPITKAIIEHHGGTVCVLSTGSEGTTFRIVLPLGAGGS